MKTILFPTDFSASADNALNYAVGLCETLKTKLVLLHASHVPALASQVPMETITEERIFAEATDQLKKYKAHSVLNGKNITVEECVTYGLAVDSIVAEAEEGNVDLIVMGTKGASGLEEVLVGSNTASVMEKASCPVLAVPGKASFHKLKKIVFASDYNESDFAAIRFLTHIASLFNAEIIIVHVSDIIHDDLYEKDIFDRFKERLGKEIDYKNLSFNNFVGLNIAKTLNSFVEQSNIDMIALCPRKRNIISKFFDRSLTKKMAYHTEIPLLSIPV